MPADVKSRLGEQEFSSDGGEALAHTELRGKGNDGGDRTEQGGGPGGKGGKRPAVTPGPQQRREHPQEEEEAGEFAEQEKTEGTVPAARPKAKARPAQKGAKVATEVEEEWPEEPSPYQPPPLQRAQLAGRAEALERRASQLAADDPRREKAQERMHETEKWLKEMGGRKGEKVPFVMLDGKRMEERCKKGVEKARGELAEARHATARALEAEGRAEAELRAWEARLENAKNKNAHVRMQSAVDGLAGLEGFGDLVQSFSVLGALAATNGSEVALQAGRHVERFILQFQQAAYNEDYDPYLQDLASAVHSEATTIEIGTTSRQERRKEGEEGEAEEEGPHKRARLPLAFDTAITAEFATRLAQAEQSRPEQVERPQVWRLDTLALDQGGESVEGNKGAQSKKEK